MIIGIGALLTSARQEYLWLLLYILVATFFGLVLFLTVTSLSRLGPGQPSLAEPEPGLDDDRQ